ncbi:uncharacterized protein N7503_000425 [Penicillium pulvis]|uniref:uncharacterized protein n=1 Tax=Penicillium pulvis TaxID=1562058 RepID=UPI002547E78A|nr:uncharacterized protein N7503_000425 [Penicillium pulvis]KAJ5813675.1 hypothetical protein N7503_000425 [Penicillium pulvis]
MADLKTRGISSGMFNTVNVEAAMIYHELAGSPGRVDTEDSSFGVITLADNAIVLFNFVTPDFVNDKFLKKRTKMWKHAVFFQGGRNSTATKVDSQFWIDQSYTFENPKRLHHFHYIYQHDAGCKLLKCNNIIASTLESAFLAQPSFNEYFQLNTRTNASQLKGGGYYASAFIGVFFVGILADRWGRKRAIAVGAILTLISGALLSASVNVAMFIAFRFLSGAGSSILLAGVPLWMNEVVSAKDRGPLVDIHGAMFQVGFAMSSWVGYGFYSITSRTIDAWRAPQAFQCLAPLITLAILPFLPESPRWLLLKDRVEEARQILSRSHSIEECNIELAQIHTQMQIDRSLNSSYVHIFRKSSYRKRAFLAICTCVMAQCSGVLVVNNYGPTIYASLGYDNDKQLLLSAVWSTFGVFCSFAGLTFVDRLTRPRLLSFGLFVYCGELFPSALRAKGLSLGVAGINLTNVLFLTVAPVAFSHIGWKFYLVFIITSGLSAVAILFLWPDTHGLRLEEIDALFGDNVGGLDESTVDGNLNVKGAVSSKLEDSSEHLEFAQV